MLLTKQQTKRGPVILNDNIPRGNNGRDVVIFNNKYDQIGENMDAIDIYEIQIED